MRRKQKSVRELEKQIGGQVFDVVRGQSRRAQTKPRPTPQPEPQETPPPVEEPETEIKEGK